MLDFEIQRSERRCSVTDRELSPGEYFYSVILDHEGEIVRRDYSLDAWQGPPENCVGWWKTQVPSLATLRMKWAPNDVMLHYFERLADDPSKLDVRYVLSLLMLRRKILVQQDSTELTDGTELIQYHCSRNGREYEVQVVDLAPNRIEQIQNELAELLYCPGSSSVTTS